MSDHVFSRRYFFYGSLLAGAVPAGGFGSVPSLVALGFKAFTEKLNIAVIGLGTRGPQIQTGVNTTENVVTSTPTRPPRHSRNTRRPRSTKTIARCWRPRGRTSTPL